MKKLIRELKDLDFNLDERRDLAEQMFDDDFSLEFGNTEYRFIKESVINDVMKDELSDDKYILGCFTPWFIADITGLDLDVVEKAQADDSYELLGALMLNNIDEVVDKYIMADGYGHHFSHYDGNELTAGEYLVFRTN